MQKSSLVLLGAAVVFSSTAIASQGIFVRTDIKHDLSLPYRQLGKPNLRIFNLNNKQLSKLDLTANQLVPLKGFQGLGVGFPGYTVSAIRPDISAAVGMSQYVESVTPDIAVFDKLTGTISEGFPKAGSNLWNGFGGTCEGNGKGNLIVRYDQLAHRWLVSQFAYIDPVQGPFAQCVAVSTSEDAAGTYNRYEFHVDSFTDYTKIGVWPDAYYLSLNMQGPASFGPLACALDRQSMIAGTPATIQCKQLTTAESGPLLPVELEGQVLPPTGNPGYFVSINEPENILFFKFHADFANPSNATLSTGVPVPVSNYTSACRTTGGTNCVIQPNTTTKLNTLSDRLVSRLTYRQFPNYGSLMVNHTIEGPQPKFAPSVRWYEFRILKNNPTFNPIVYQQATIAPDSKNRYLGSIGVDRFGNIAMGYNVTSSLIFPSLELAYHKYTDLTNVTTIQPLVTGKGSQLDTSEWGRYSVMAIDPSDSCTFWYTGEYIQASGTSNWSTFAVHFKLPPCGEA